MCAVRGTVYFKTLKYLFSGQAPRVADSKAIAAPIPRDPPVIIAVFPSKGRGNISFAWLSLGSKHDSLAVSAVSLRTRSEHFWKSGLDENECVPKLGIDTPYNF
jgi:hypothetical protein